MRLRHLKMLLWIAGTGLSFGCPLVIAWGFLWPFDEPQTIAQVADVSPQEPSESQTESGTLEVSSFAGVWNKQLQRPLYDPPPPQRRAAPPPRRPPPLQVKLVGTSLDSNNAMAMFATPRGTIEIKRVGDTVGGIPSRAQVVRIDRKQVVVRYAGQDVTLELPKAGS